MTAEEWFKKGQHHLDLSRGADSTREYHEDLTDACEAFAQCLALDTSHYEAQWLRGSTLFTLERYEEALDCLVAAAAQRPDDLDVVLTAARCLLELEHHPRAVPMFERVLARRPDDPEALWGLARSLTGLKDFARAVPALEAMIARTPPRSMRAFSLPHARAELANALFTLNRPGAYETFAELLERDWTHYRGPSGSDAFFALLVHFEPARQALRTWADAHHDDPERLYFAALAWAKAGYQGPSQELNRASVAAWDRVLATQRGNHSAWYEKANAHARLEQWAQARAAYQRAHELWPDFIAAADGVRRMDEKLAGPWTLMGSDTFAREDYVVRRFDTFDEAQAALAAKEAAAERTQTDEALRDTFWLVRGSS